jgi:hypothetical protein
MGNVKAPVSVVRIARGIFPGFEINTARFRIIYRAVESLWCNPAASGERLIRKITDGKVATGGFPSEITTIGFNPAG